MPYTIIIPVLNEEENLSVLLPKLVKLNGHGECEILVCDNGSTDGSVNIAETLGARVSKGEGTVVDAVLRGIKESSHDRFIVMDADLSHPHYVVPSLLNKLDTCDIAVGSRYLKWGDNRDSKWNKIVSRVFNAMAVGLAPKVKDRISGFWGAKKSVTDVEIRRTTKPMLEFLVRSGCTSVGEVPYIFTPRTNGKSKIGRSYWTFVKEFYGLTLLYAHKYWRILAFLFAGGTGVIVSTSTYWVFTQYADLQYIWASIPSLWLANFNNFMWNDNLTFRKLRRDKSWVRRYSEFLTIYGSTALLDILILWFLTSIVGVWYYASFCLALVMATAIRMLVSFKYIWGNWSLRRSK